MTFLESGFSAPELRRLLVARVRGLGWKEASHFLRNIGYRNLAILDRHILRNLVRHRAILSMPGTLTPARYLMIESRFARLAAAAGITMDELDLLFWKRETGFILK
jgi:N-glycosylase/DNA lyase